MNTKKKVLKLSGNLALLVLFTAFSISLLCFSLFLAIGTVCFILSKDFLPFFKMFPGLTLIGLFVYFVLAFLFGFISLAWIVQTLDGIKEWYHEWRRIFDNDSKNRTNLF